MDYIQTHLRQNKEIADTAHTAALRVNQSSRLISAGDDFMENTTLPRPPTAGTAASAASKERAKILKVQAMHLYVIQVALLTVLFGLLAMWIMPPWAAHMALILILATGIGAAFYLSQI